jgi:chemotaxis protein methyltransferase CheR
MISSAELSQDFAKFIELIKTKTGIDLALYKEGQMQRRLSNMKDKRGFRSFKDFFHAMTKDQALYDDFLDYMTINVSEFYRNSGRWAVLEKRIAPAILSSNSRIKCWSAACSTGEEPYTLVMLLSSLMNLRDVQVLATDIDQNVIEKAKIGKYQALSVKEVPKPHLNKFFSLHDGQYIVSDEIKKCVKFKRHNLLADPYEQNFDLIICRNVLIYFTDEAKETLFDKFSKSLKKGGYFFVGGTEQIFQPHKYQLEQVDTFFYKKL